MTGKDPTRGLVRVISTDGSVWWVKPESAVPDTTMNVAHITAGNAAAIANVNKGNLK